MRRRGLTLIELLVVVAVVAILATIGFVHYAAAHERALQAAGASNLHAIAAALQSYLVDEGRLPFGDQVAGPFASQDSRQTGNAPAAGGSWNGVPWSLYELGYVGDWKTLFCPKYLRLYRDGKTIKGDWPRYHNFRYAYNSGGARTGGYRGGSAGANIMSGDRQSWLVRDLYLPAEAGFYGFVAPRYPADYAFPWGDAHDRELAIWADLAVRMVLGGSNTPLAPEDRP